MYRYRRKLHILFLLALLCATAVIAQEETTRPKTGLLLLFVVVMAAWTWGLAIRKRRLRRCRG